jgi:exonuclease III
MINKPPSIKIASLNCRGLTKINRQNQQEYFISTLRSLQYDILVLQETHAKTTQLEDTFNKKFHSTSSMWTEHCAIISLNNKFKITNPWKGEDNRIISADIKIEQGNNLEQKVAIVINIYAPTKHKRRKIFFNRIVDNHKELIESSQK